MKRTIQALLAVATHLASTGAQVNTAACPEYGRWSAVRHGPFSEGVYKLSSMRPAPECRTFTSPIVDKAIQETVDAIADPDLKQLFQNAYPNTLDTTVAWRGVSAKDPQEELAFIITGDIPAMWLRDSANQLLSYAPLLEGSDSSDSLAGLYRGALNLQARYIRAAPFCQAFQPPPESGIPRAKNWADHGQKVTPEFPEDVVFECKWELDSYGSFLELSQIYYEKTKDLAFFRRTQWVDTVKLMMHITANMTAFTTYNPDGTMMDSPYTHSDFMNGGVGSPIAAGTGLIRSFFRPSDDGTQYQFFIPPIMMYSRFLKLTADIMDRVGPKELAQSMKTTSSDLRAAITEHAIVHTKQHGNVYAFEVDGFGGVNLMDDANSPSLLSSAYFGYNDKNDEVYQNTRQRILSSYNPYWAHGNALSAVGGPHNGPKNGWPMSSVMRILTSDDDEEIKKQIHQILSSTDGLGLIHESVNAHDASTWTRSWFAWANGLFGQAIMELKDRKPHILKISFQDGLDKSHDDMGKIAYKPGNVFGDSGAADDHHGTTHMAGEHSMMDKEESSEHAHKEPMWPTHQGSLSDTHWLWYLVGVLAVCSAFMIIPRRAINRYSRV